jgi:hypothetical protein
MKRNVSSTSVPGICSCTADSCGCVKSLGVRHALVCLSRSLPDARLSGSGSGDCRQRWRDRFGSTAAGLGIVLAMLGILPNQGQAARVSGVLTAYEATTPQVSRDLHFENMVTGDMYLSPTHSDGSFGTSLPPGKYWLRTETGAILVRSIAVDRANLDLGHVSELAPLALQRLWQAQAVAPSILIVPAPSTAYVMTADTTPLPATAVAVPKPEFDWTKPPPETEASAASEGVTGLAALPPKPPRAPSPSQSTSPGWMGGAPYSPPTAPQGASSP